MKKASSNSRSARLPSIALTAGQLRAIEGLARGRQLAIKRAKERRAINAKKIMKEAIKDLEAGEPARGRAKRIHLNLPLNDLGKPIMTERSVKRILDTLSVCPIRQEHTRDKQEVLHHAK